MKTFNKDILSRFLSSKELRDLEDSYKENTMYGGSNRELSLEKQVTKKEKNFLRDYLNDFDKTVKELGDKHNISSPYSAAGRIALRVLYQEEVL